MAQERFSSFKNFKVSNIFRNAKNVLNMGVTLCCVHFPYVSFRCRSKVSKVCFNHIFFLKRGEIKKVIIDPLKKLSLLIGF
jgi:hypothetical protein